MECIAVVRCKHTDACTHARALISSFSISGILIPLCQSATNSAFSCSFHTNDNYDKLRRSVKVQIQALCVGIVYFSFFFWYILINPMMIPLNGIRCSFVCFFSHQYRKHGNTVRKQWLIIIFVDFHSFRLIRCDIRSVMCKPRHITNTRSVTHAGDSGARSPTHDMITSIYSCFCFIHDCMQYKCIQNCHVSH